MRFQGKRVKRTRWIRTERFVVAVDVEAVILDADPDEAVYEPATVDLLRQVEAHAHSGDIEWLRQHGKVYAALETV